jgi:hypothetical protein
MFALPAAKKRNKDDWQEECCTHDYSTTYCMIMLRTLTEGREVARASAAATN